MGLTPAEHQARTREIREKHKAVCVREATEASLWGGLKWGGITAGLLGGVRFFVKKSRAWYGIRFITAATAVFGSGGFALEGEHALAACALRREDLQTHKPKAGAATYEGEKTVVERLRPRDA